MAIYTSITSKHFGDSDDDDGPTVFKRSYMTSKQNQLCSEIKKSSSQRHDESSGRHVSGLFSPNGQKLSLEKGKMVLSTKTSEVWSTVGNSNASTSIAEKLKRSSEKKSAVNDMEKKPPLEPSADSDDDKPLIARLFATSTSVPMNNSTHVSKDLGSPAPCSSLSEKTKGGVNKSSEDLEQDEIPSSSEFQLKSGAGSSSEKFYNSNEKHLASKVQQNGSFKGSNELVKSPKVLNKRTLSHANPSAQSSIKKPKLSDVQVPAQIKQVPVKEDPKIEAGDNIPLAQRLPTKIKQVPEKTEPKREDCDNIPLAQRIPAKLGQVPVKAEPKIEDGDNIPFAQRMKSAALDDKPQSTKKTVTKVVSSSFLKTTQKLKKMVNNSKYSKSSKVLPGSGEGQKWTTLVHNGVIFPPPCKPHGVKMLYNGHLVDLTLEQEEVATMFAVMKDTEYATKPRFIENFMNDWRLILGKTHIIKKFELCDFTPIYEWHQKEKEKKKQLSSDEKKALKDKKLKQEEKYMWAIVDGVKEKVGNFRVEPPGLFRGRGEHPKMGGLKKRIRPSDITINIGKDAPIPECPIPGQRWKEVKHDNTVTWLAFWNDPINPREFKYVFLVASSSLKGQSDKEKYEKARMLKTPNYCHSLFMQDYIHHIRATYTKDFTSKDTTKRQIAVATYLIDKLALRAGNEKDDDEADTVGCCTLKVENVTLVPPNKLQFDFLGKDSIRYFNTVEVELPVCKAIGQFKSGKSDGDDLFDKLDTSKLNAHLKELMPGLTAKVFRTYNASITLDEMLNRETKDGNVAGKIVVYQHANKEVAIVCNHQRSVSKSHSAQMSRLSEKMDELKAVLDGLKLDLGRVKGKPPLKDADGKPKKNWTPEALEKKIAQINAKIEKMERAMKTKEDLKTVALGTSKINYLDPRISVAWCKRHEVPIEKIFNKSLLAKFAWAMDVDPIFRF